MHVLFFFWKSTYVSYVSAGLIIYGENSRHTLESFYFIFALQNFSDSSRHFALGESKLVKSHHQNRCRFARRRIARRVWNRIEGTMCVFVEHSQTPRPTAGSQHAILERSALADKRWVTLLLQASHHCGAVIMVPNIDSGFANAPINGMKAAKLGFVQMFVGRRYFLSIMVEMPLEWWNRAHFSFLDLLC